MRIVAVTTARADGSALQAGHGLARGRAGRADNTVAPRARGHIVNRHILHRPVGGRLAEGAQNGLLGLLDVLLVEQHERETRNLQLNTIDRIIVDDQQIQKSLQADLHRLLDRESHLIRILHVVLLIAPREVTTELGGDHQLAVLGGHVRVVDEDHVEAGDGGHFLLYLLARRGGGLNFGSRCRGSDG